MRFWNQTLSGMKLDLEYPAPEQIRLHDICAGLSKKCRFSGQCEGFYSVAEHSLNVSELVDGGAVIIALLHDAAEAYIGDIPTPFKRLIEDLGCPLQTLEKRILEAVFERFGIEDWEFEWDRVMGADRKMLSTERYHLLPHHLDWEHPLPDPDRDFVFRRLDERAAYQEFSQRLLRWL